MDFGSTEHIFIYFRCQQLALKIIYDRPATLFLKGCQCSSPGDLPHFWTCADGCQQVSVPMHPPDILGHHLQMVLALD